MKQTHFMNFEKSNETKISFTDQLLRIFLFFDYVILPNTHFYITNSISKQDYENDNYIPEIKIRFCKYDGYIKL